MALEEVVESLEGIDERYHDLYVEGEDGKFSINIDGLKSALSKERNKRKSLEKKVNKNENSDVDIDLQAQLTEAQNTIKNMKINSILKSVALSSGIDADYVDDVITLTKGNFGLDEDGNVVIIDKDGEILDKSVDTYFKSDFKKSKPRYYVNSGKTGSGSNPNLGEPSNLSYQGKLQKAIENKDLSTLIHLKHNRRQ